MFWLASPEGDDAPDRIVRRHADGHAISGDDLDAEAAHATAELREDFVARIALDAVKTAAVHGDDGALHVNQIVLAQTASVPFYLNNHCATEVALRVGASRRRSAWALCVGRFREGASHGRSRGPFGWGFE